MKLFIPELGTVLKLEKDWEFWLYAESRNDSFSQAIWLSPDHYDDEKSIKRGWEKISNASRFDFVKWKRKAKLPIGAELKVDRIYIRKGAAEYSSISFFLDKNSLPDDHVLKKAKSRIRFWVKLKDANQIEFQ